MAPVTMSIGVMPADLMKRAYEYRHSLRHWNVVTQAVCVSISTICVCMRMYSKLLITRAPGWEDYTCLVAWLGLIGYAVIACEADKYGSGVHVRQVAPADLQKYAQLANASQITYGPLIFLTKLSILLLYLRAFTPAFRSKTFLFIQILLWSNLIFYLANTLLKVFQCIPREKIWNPKVPGHCLNINIPILVAASINVVSDVLILLVPMVCVWRLQMRLPKKLGVCAIFAAGSFGCISSIMRLVISVRNRHVTDPTYDWFPQFLWTSAEVASGIIASCLPALPSFFRHFFRRAVTKFSTHSSGNSSGIGKAVRDATIGSEGHASRSRRRRQPSTTELLQRSAWEMEVVPAPEWERTQPGSGSGFLATEVTAEASRSAGRDVEVSSLPGTIRVGQLPCQKGILKTVEVDIESYKGQEK